MAGRSISELVVQAHSSRLYTVSMESRFGNWTDAEISQHFKPAVAPEAKSTSFAAPSTRRGASTDDGDLTVDWTAFAGVVHDQRECGACWAFSAADSVAASIAISDGGRVEELAAQELVDCDDGSARGCAGGNPREALDYVQAFGVGLAADYPYEARQTVCRKNATRPAAAVHRVEYIRSEAAMLQALKRGPVAIGVAASQRSFLLYRSGVYDDEASADLPLDHALLVVGAGRTLDGTPYWKMKSSWSTAWGENGYATNRVPWSWRPGYPNPS
ncbi:hypothetical protein M885DRAFT_56477 [Pelagophyceae sp. CCMP2097]|nr:hypothetical protein M885DRAFT_56477 [Pelagophyceae sp. CCMP2097]